jgi:integrase
MINVKNLLLKKNWPNKTIWLAAMTVGMTGVRAGEVCSLMWQDIIIEKKIIFISRSYNIYEGVKSTKSGKPRIFPYPKALQVILEPHRGDPMSYAFSIKEGKPLAYYALRSAMKRAKNRVAKETVNEKKKTAGEKGITEEDKKKIENCIAKITLHGLRHSINTALLEAGVNPELLRASFGWVDKETQEIYTHRDLYNLAPQSEAIDVLFEGFTGE